MQKPDGSGWAVHGASSRRVAVQRWEMLGVARIMLVSYPCPSLIVTVRVLGGSVPRADGVMLS